MENESGTDLVVLSPRWLCVDVIGTLLSHEKIVQARITGCFSVDEFQIMFPDTDASSLLQVRYKNGLDVVMVYRRHCFHSFSKVSYVIDHIY